MLVSICAQGAVWYFHVNGQDIVRMVLESVYPQCGVLLQFVSSTPHFSASSQDSVSIGLKKDHVLYWRFF